MLRDKLLIGEEELVIFGAGYIGYSTAAFYAKRGVSSTLIDIDSGKIHMINCGEPPYEDMKTWLGFPIKPHAHLIKASEWRERTNPVYFISVNTERDGEPWDEALIDVCKKISVDPTLPLVIVESTLTPGWTYSIIKPLLKRVAVAPRRDWFTLPGMSVETLDRVVGATDRHTLDEAVDVLGIISRRIHRASSYRVAEMVKAVENAYRQVGIALSYELTEAYPNLNIREVLKLCSTKWNMELYHPSIGMGGYCIPIAPKYILSAAEKPLKILEASMEADRRMPYLVAEQLSRRDIKSVCILGAAYKGDLKVHVSSQGLRLAEVLMEKGFKVSVSDPLYKYDELRALTEADVVNFPYCLPNYDCVIVACDHSQYKAVSKTTLLLSLERCRVILDCFGIWSHLRDRLKEKEIEYHEVGDEGWLL